MSSTAPMRPEDADAVAALFFRAFRKPGATPPEDFVRYFRDSFFGSPLFEPSLGGLVHRDANGQVDSALAAIPMQVSVNGRIITGRLMANYMTEPAKRTRGGADMVLTLRARLQEFCFSDSANRVSADHWKAVGGMVLPIQSLDWRVVFRPGGWYLHRLLDRLPKRFRRVARALGWPATLWHRRQAMPVGVTTRVMGRDEFLTLAPDFVERFAVHPVWSRTELDWVLGMAEASSVHGPLAIHAVERRGRVVGCFVHYSRKCGIAQVLNLLCAKGYEHDLVGAVLATLDALGCAGATGMAQPFLMFALSNVARLGFRPRGAFCISTRHAEIRDAAARGDIYVGGLLGESWSRLMTDFWD